MANNMINKDTVEKVLSTFLDPESGRNIVQLEQVHDLRIDANRLKVMLGLTTFSAPLWNDVQLELVNHLKKQLPQLEEVEVDLTLHERPAQKIGEVGLAAKCVIAVGSGKGGVGKSTISTAIAYGLSQAGCRVGLLDADVYGPSIPHMIGSDEQPQIIDNRIEPIVVDNLAVMSMGFLVPKEEAVIWRGPMLHTAITQFLRDTNWGDLDYLVIDMPPGTGDTAISLSQLLPLSGAVIVCTPQDVALLDATRATAMFRQINVDVLGMVENMSFFICPDCGSRHEIFGSDGARKAADELKIPFLGEVPINTQLRIQGDKGKVQLSLQDENSRPYLTAICQRLVQKIVDQRRTNPTLPELPILNN